MIKEQPPIVASGIEFGSAIVREVGEQASMERIVVQDISGCRLRFGPIVKYPKIQILVGLLMLSGIVLAVLAFVGVLSSGRKSGIYLEASLIVIAGIGAWPVRDAISKVHHLEVRTAAGVSKLRLLGPIDERTLVEISCAAAQGSKLVV